MGTGHRGTRGWGGRPALPRVACPVGVGSLCPRLSRAKPGVGRWGPGGPALGSPFAERSGLAAGAGGRAGCLLLFDLNRVGFGFLLLWGPFVFFHRLWPAPGADVGARSVGSGAPRSPSGAARRGRLRGARLARPLTA